MKMDGTKVSLNDIIKKQINIGCCFPMEPMTVQNWMTLMKQK